MRPLKFLILTPLFLCAFVPSTSSAASVMHDQGVSTTGYLAASSVSLTTDATTWGYISSTGTYLPNLATNRISTTSISTTNLTVTGTPTASTDVATKSYVDSVVAAAGGSSAPAQCSNLGSAICSATFLKNATLSQKTFYAIATSTDGSKMAVAANSDYIYTSADSGTTWTQRPNSGARNWRKVTISDNGNILYAATNDSSGSSMGLFKSADGGATWTQLNSTYQYNTYFDVSRDGNTIFAAPYLSSTYYIAYSTNGGTSWTSVTNTSSSFFGISISPNGMNMAYSYGSSGSYLIRRSLNRAAFTTAATATNYWYNYPVILDDGNIFAIYASSNYLYKIFPNNQIAFPFQLASGSITSLNVSPDGLKILIGANSDYLYLSTNGGETFNPVTQLGKAYFYTTTPTDGSKFYLLRGNLDSPPYVLTCQ